jgi:hypothetical protein
MNFITSAIILRQSWFISYLGAVISVKISDIAILIFFFYWDNFRFEQFLHLFSYQLTITYKRFTWQHFKFSSFIITFELLSLDVVIVYTWWFNTGEETVPIEFRRICTKFFILIWRFPISISIHIYLLIIIWLKWLFLKEWILRLICINEYFYVCFTRYHTDSLIHILTSSS